MQKLLLLILLFAIQATFNPASAQKRAKKVKAKTPTEAYYVRFPKDSTSTHIDAYMLGLAHPVTFIIKVKKGKRIMARINEMAEPGNVRINQIIMPDGATDGPFSKSIEYPIIKKGIYKLIIGGSNMQGDNWKGAFTLHVAIM